MFVFFSTIWLSSFRYLFLSVQSQVWVLALSVFVVIKTIWVPKRVCVCVCGGWWVEKANWNFRIDQSTLHYFSRVLVHLFHESFMNICLFISQLKLFILSYCATNDGISLPSPLGKNGIQNGGHRRKMRRSRLWKNLAFIEVCVLNSFLPTLVMASKWFRS